MRPLMLLLLAGCAHLTIDPSVHSKKSFALVAFYGQETIPTPVGVVGSFSQNRWGVELADKIYKEVYLRLSETMGLLPSAERVQMSPSYMSLPLATFGSHKASPAGLRPLDAGNNAGLGKLAVELGVEAVMVIANTWLIMDDGRGQYGQDAMEIVIVGADGRRLWDERIILDSGHAEQTGRQMGAEMLGVAWEREAKEMAHEAVMRCLAKFAHEWKGDRGSVSSEME
jgi:hypothetical protein